MSQSIQETLETYAMNKAKIKVLTDQNNELQLTIIPALLLDPKDGDTAYGKFKVSDYKSYEYPMNLVSMEDELKAMKAKAISVGEAKISVKPSLKFSPVKL